MYGSAHGQTIFWLICCEDSTKDWRLKKLTTFAFGQFPTISGHFLAKHITIFQKTYGSDGHFEGAKHV